MRTLAVEVPDEVYLHLTRLPKAERVAYFAAEAQRSFPESVLLAVAEEMYCDMLDAKFPTKEDELADLIAAVNEGGADYHAGRWISLEDMIAQWNLTDEDLRNAPDGLVNRIVERGSGG